jgi:hypothetical protein
MKVTGLSGNAAAGCVSENVIAAVANPTRADLLILIRNVLPVCVWYFAYREIYYWLTRLQVIFPVGQPSSTITSPGFASFTQFVMPAHAGHPRFFLFLSIVKAKTRGSPGQAPDCDPGQAGR